MKNSILFVLSFFAALVSFQCGENSASASGFTAQGTIASAGGMTVHLEKFGINPMTNTSQPLGNATADATGKFEIKLPTKPAAGWYRIRVGEQRATLILDGTETNVTVNGNLVGLNQIQYDVSGSAASIAYRSIMQKAAARQLRVEDVAAFTDTTANALTAAAVVTHTMANHPSSVTYHQKAAEKLEKMYPGSTNIEEYKTFINSIQAQQAMAGAGGGAAGANGFQYIEPAQRQAAPDIKMPSPNGKQFALSSLKGKVVLLDFWASWCGPCRRENPSVVNIYNKYKDKGFTVFSVSLDGIDSRQAAMFGNDPAKLKEAQEGQKKRWTDAIAQDGLIWETHVSELKKWESAPVQAYGVNSIPRTFMIDKEGKIAAVNLRGAEQIEQALLKLL